MRSKSNAEETLLASVIFVTEIYRVPLKGVFVSNPFLYEERARAN